jgi:hypothetical protein
MPVDNAFDREIDPVSCMLYPINMTEPIIQCGNRQGLVCLQAYGVMVRVCVFVLSLRVTVVPVNFRQLGSITVGIPFIFWVYLRRALNDDPIAVRLSEFVNAANLSVGSPCYVSVVSNAVCYAVWWREHREQLRLILNAPRSFVVLIIYLIGFGRVVIKCVPCLLRGALSSLSSFVYLFAPNTCTETGTSSLGFVGTMSSQRRKTCMSWLASPSTACSSHFSNASMKSLSSRDETILISGFPGLKSGGDG